MIIHSFRTVRSNVVKRKIISAFLTFLLLFQNVAPVAQLSIVMAQDATPVVEQVQPTPAPESTPAPETTPTPEAPPVPAETPAPEAIVEPTPVQVPTPPSDSAPVEEPPESPVPAFNPTDVLGIPLNLPTLQPEVIAEQEPELVVQECLLDDAQIKESVSSEWKIDLEEGIATTNEKVQLGVKYIFPQENKVSVTFRCLPKDESLRSPLKIQQVKVSDLKLPNATKVDGEYAYDITTDMKDGDFAYDVTLPKSENKNASVSYIEKSIDEAKQEVKAEDFKTVSETDTTKVNQELKGEDITATGMDHFTIFVVVYNSQPAVIPGSFPSVGFQATSTFEFGDHLFLAGTDRSAERITVGMTNWACENDFTFTDGNWVKNRADNEACVTTPGSSYIHPLTLNVYEADTSGVVPVVGSLVLTKTINAAIPFRPSYDQQCTAPGSDSPFGGTWFDSVSNSCVHGFNFDAVFDLAGQTLPDNVIVTIAFNTQSYGLNPIGQNGPYNSLNMSVGNVSASAGTNVNPDDVFQYSTHAPNYTDGGASGVGILRQDTGWSGYVPVIKVEVTAPPQVSCGDGVVNQESEQCDYGTSNGSSNCSQSCQWVSSCSEVMAVNGSFETPVVTNGAKWDAFDNAQVPGWTAAWIGGSPTYGDYSRPEPKIELHNGVLGAAAQGDQYAELDSDWGGPDQNYSGEPASIALSQTIPTIVGNQYTVSWKYAPRPNHTNNHLQVTIDGSEVFNSGVIAGAGSIIWLTESKTFTATATTTVISFNESGTADSFGMFLDDVTVSCQGPPVCTEGPTWASSVVSSTQGKLKNGNTITDPLRTDPLQVLGANDNKFFSLGYGGEIIVSFAGYIIDKPNANDLSFHEITNGRNTYPVERANVKVSQDNITYVDLGYVTNKDGVGGVAYKDLSGSGLDWIKYVKITDATNDPALELTADGYDLDAVDATQQVCEEPVPTNSDVTVCKKDPSGAGLPGWQVQLYKSNAVANLSVPATNGIPVSFSSVPAGDYILRAKGDYTYRPGIPGAEYSDAGWSKRAPSDSVYVGAFLPWVKVSTFPSPNTGWLGVMVNDDTADWGTYFNPAHTYFKSFENYAGGVISAKILDDVYSDNSGGVSLDLHEGYTGVTNEEDGCVTFADVPYGDYYLDETGRDGWENVSGIGTVTIDTTQESFDIVNQETIIPLIPQIAVDKTGPQFLMENSPITYNYSVTNPGQAPLSSVTVADDKCSTPAYLSGDTNTDTKLDLNETWLFSCTITPTWSFNTTLTNTAIASGVYDQITVTSTDQFSLQSVVMRKDVVLQSGNGTTEYSDPNTQFSVQVKQGSTVLGTTTISESAPANMWLAPGQYSFCEVNLPTGYTAQYPNCYNFNTNSYPDFTQINILTPAKIVASKVVCESESYLPNWHNGADINENTAKNFVDASNGKCWYGDDWNFQWGFADKTGQQGVDKLSGDVLGFAAGQSSEGLCSAPWCGPNTTTGSAYNQWKTFGSTDSNNYGLTEVVINDLEGAPGIWVREALQQNYIPYSYPPDSSPGSNVSAELYCHTDVANYDNFDQIASPQPGQTYYCVALNAQRGSVHGYKWDDINGDRLRQTCDTDQKTDRILDETELDCANEELLPGWTIELYRITKDEGGPIRTLVDSMATDSGNDHYGMYWFDNLPYGEYEVCEVQQLGWAQTYPESPICHSVSLPDQNSNGFDVVLNATEGPMYNFGNQQVGRLMLSKLNNVYPAIKAPGDIVNYTLTVTAKDGPLDDVLVTDVPPDGFSYVLGSWTAVSDIRGDIKNSVTTEPTYGSPGDWILGSMEPDEVVTLTYDAKIDSEITAGTHPDLAYAYGNQIGGPTVYAVAQDPGFVTNDFAGTQVQVAVNNPGGTLSHEVERKETVEGQVLGASTELPATGMPLTLPLIGFGMFITGLLTLLAGLFIRRRHALGRVASGIGVALFILISLVTPASAAGSLSLRVEQLPSPYNQREFKLRYVVLDIDNRPITIECYKKGPSDAGYSLFSSPTAIQAGGDNHYCNVTSDLTGEAGTYQFQVKAYAGADVFPSPVQAVDLRTNTGPGTPTNYSRDRQSCKDKLTFRSADDGGKTARIEVYRSDNRSFTADSGSRIDNFGAGSNENFTKEYDRPDCSKSYYFVVRAFDSANNGSGLVGDTETIVTTVNITTTTTTTQSTGALPVLLDEGDGGVPARTGGSILGAADLFDDVTDLNNDGMIDEAELAAASESAKVAAAAQFKADQEKNQAASQGAVLGSAILNFFSSLPAYVWWILGAILIVLLIAAAARFL